MTTLAKPRVKARRENRFEQIMAKAPVHIAVILLALIWTLPTLGLLISSFRPQDEVLSSGWWTVFLHPFEFTQFTLANYLDVMLSQGMAQAFLNSLVIAIPATIMFSVQC